MANNNLWPTHFSGNFVAGHPEHDSYWWGGGGQLGGFDGCGNPSIVVEATQIPSWFWLAAGAVALLFLMKKR